MKFIAERPIPYGRQTITQDDLSAVLDVLQSDYLTQGPTVGHFERAFAEYIGSQYAVALANGTAALHLCAMVLNVQPGDKVITSPITFTASANCVRYCGGEVVFMDIDPETYLLDVRRVRQHLERLSWEQRSAYKGVIPVDFAGRPCELSEWRALADEFGLWVLEDSCHAPGATFVDKDGIKRRSGDGTLADMAIFSFHPVKHVATGEGGAITTNRHDLYERLNVLRTHGITRDATVMHENHGGWYYEMHELGYNYRLTDIQAALGISQLRRAAENLERRLAIARRYDQAFAGTAVTVRPTPPNVVHAHHLYVVEVEHRRELYDALRAKNIFAQVHYIPVHLQPYYRQFGWKRGDLPCAEAYYERCLSLPMFPALTNDEQDYVIASVLECTQ